MGRWSRPVAEAVLAWLRLPPGRSWLDVGCGTGALTEAILDAADPREVVGVDPSADFLATAAAQIADPRVRFAIGEARAAGAERCLRRGHRRPGPALRARPAAGHPRDGARRRSRRHCDAYVWDFAGERQFTRYFWQVATALDPAAADYDPGRVCSLCHPEPLAALFAGAGLQAVTVQAVEVPIVFRDFDDYWRPHLLGGSSPAQRYAASQGAEQRTALRERLHATLPIADDGSIPLLGRLWAVRSTKDA